MESNETPVAPSNEDLQYILETTVNILEFTKEPQMLELKKINFDEYLNALEKKYEKFTLKYYGIFRMIVDNDDSKSIDKLFGMLNLLWQVNAGKLTLTNADALVSEGLSNEYVYPKFGGKQNFEKIIKNRNKK